MGNNTNRQGPHEGVRPPVDEQREAIDRMRAKGLPIRNDNIDTILGRNPQRPPLTDVEERMELSKRVDEAERRIHNQNLELLRLERELQAARKPPVIRCSTCKGTLIGKSVDGEIVIYHSCYPNLSEELQAAQAELLEQKGAADNYRNALAAAQADLAHLQEVITGYKDEVVTIKQLYGESEKKLVWERQLLVAERHKLAAAQEQVREKDKLYEDHAALAVRVTDLDEQLAASQREVARLKTILKSARCVHCDQVTAKAELRCEAEQMGASKLLKQSDRLQASLDEATRLLKEINTGSYQPNGWWARRDAFLAAQPQPQGETMTTETKHCDVGCAPICTVCGLRKNPIGRSAPLEMASSLCDHDCEGYYLYPTACDLWPGEKRAANIVRDEFAASQRECRGLQFDRDQFGRELKACREDRERATAALKIEQEESQRWREVSQKLGSSFYDARGLLEWAQKAWDDKDGKLVSHYPSGSGWKRKVDAFLAAQPQNGGSHE